MRSLRSILSLAVLSLLSIGTLAGEKETARVGEDIRYLASDELEGRGVETKGIRQAAEYIRTEFKRLGVKSGVSDGTYYQKFPVPLRGKRAKVNRAELVLRGPGGEELRLDAGKDFQATVVGGSGKAKAEVVFAGYGISAPDLKYDDYQKADLAGKILVIIRRTPQQGDKQSGFAKNPRHGYISDKIELAKKYKAAAVLMVNDPHSVPTKERDTLVPVAQWAPSVDGVPFAHLKMEVLDKMLDKSPVTDTEGHQLTKVKTIEEHINKHMAPLTQKLKGWTGEIDFDMFVPVAQAENVVGVIEGEGPLAHETVVIGAHYDHLGMGGFGSRAPRAKRGKEIHNGADDNATGTAAVMELARRFARRDKKPARRMVFIAFSGEESGLVGSFYYTQKPLFPLKDTVVMINFDMIGKLRENRVTVGGAGSAKEFGEILDAANKDLGLDVRKGRGRPGGSDQLPFYNRKIPAVHFFTGLTNLYHTPEDDFETIDVDGAVRVIDLSERFLASVVSLKDRPAFVSPPPPRPVPYLGVRPDLATVAKGLVVDDVTANSPAAKAGLKPGDVIMKFGGETIKDLDSLSQALRRHKIGDTVKIVVKRKEESKTLEVKLVRRPQ